MAVIVSDFSRLGEPCLDAEFVATSWAESVAIVGEVLERGSMARVVKKMGVYVVSEFNYSHLDDVENAKNI